MDVGRWSMKFLSEKDFKISKILLKILCFSMILVPFYKNMGVRIVLTVIIILLFCNAINISLKFLKYISKK